MARHRLAGMFFLLAMLGGIAAAFAPAARPAADEGLCVPPPDTTAKWKMVKGPGMAMRMPPGFNQYYRSDQVVMYTTGWKMIGFGLGEGPDDLSTSGALDLLDACTTEIGGRPVTIKALHITLYDKMFAPTGNAGPRYVAVARWPTFGKNPTVSAYIISRDRLDLRRFKDVFYSADVGVLVVPKCLALPVLPAADSVVDSAAIALRLGARDTPWPAGTLELVLRFDSLGTLGSVAVGAGSLPDSTKRAIAMAVGTNVRERPAWSVKLRVTSAAAGFSYDVLEAISCPN